MLRAVIFNYRLLTEPTPHSTTATRDLLDWLRTNGIKIVAFSTDERSLQTLMTQNGFGSVDLHVTQTDIPGKRRGSPTWIDFAAEALGVETHELFYVGKDVLDWRTAINAAVLYVHARWHASIPTGVRAIALDNCADIIGFLREFLMSPVEWAYSYDHADAQSYLRSLLPASAMLPSTVPNKSFRLQDVLTYERTIQVGDNEAPVVLLLHAMASLYKEGMVRRNAIFTIYPSSTPGQVSNPIKTFVKPGSSLFHAYYRDDVLVRSSQAPDTSMARVRARSTGKPADVSFLTQANTVHLNPAYKGKLRSKQVIVFDDFTTTGMSVEWARNLLLAGGADEVVLLTVGKYMKPHSVFGPTDADTMKPFAPRVYRIDEFTEKPQALALNRKAEEQIRELMSIGIENSDQVEAS